MIRAEGVLSFLDQIYSRNSLFLVLVIHKVANSSSSEGYRFHSDLFFDRIRNCSIYILNFNSVFLFRRFGFRYFGWEANTDNFEFGRLEFLSLLGYFRFELGYPVLWSIYLYLVVEDFSRVNIPYFFIYKNRISRLKWCVRFGFLFDFLLYHNYYRFNIKITIL